MSGVGAEQGLEALVVELVRPALEADDLLRDRAEPARLLADGAQQRDRPTAVSLAAWTTSSPISCICRLEAAHLEQGDGLRGLVHLVDRVVHRRDQVPDVAAIERRDEGAPHREQSLAP